jgi:hypothetical protein
LGKPTSTLKAKSIAINAINPTTLGICRGMIPSTTPDPRNHPRKIPGKFDRNALQLWAWGHFQE